MLGAWSFASEKTPTREEITQAWEIWFPEIEIPLFSRKERVEFRGTIVRIKGLNKDIGPWAAPEDVKKPDDKCVVGQASRVLG